MIKRLTSRRNFWKGAAGVSAATIWGGNTLDAMMQHTSNASKPSELRITDLRVATVARAPMTCPVIRIDTNQGIYGLGEVRDGASKNYALMLKSRILGENPCNVDKIFRKIKQFGFDSRQGGGVCAIEMALWYQMLGGKFRDKIRCYADTTESDDPNIYGERLKKRKQQGFTWLKMDLGIDLISKVPGALTWPAGEDLSGGSRKEHMFAGIEITHKGAELMANFMAVVRENVGWDVPLSVDHLGHIGVHSCIRLADALEKYNPAWLEDMIPWQRTEQLREIRDHISVPLCTGEDIYLKEHFIELAKNHSVDILHPDLATSGGILETKKIGDAIQEYGVPMAMHFAGSPVSCMANVHCAAATDNFLVLENHSVDVPWWNDLVDGIEKPIVNKGFITVPDKPGLGITLNDEVMKQHLLEPGYFEPTPQWDKETGRVNDRLFS